jgi:hypothetical protein
MRALGIVVQPSSTSIRVRCVVLSGTTTTPTFEDSFELTSPCRSPDEVAPMLGNLARGLQTRLAGLAVDAVAVARANVAPTGTRQESRLRRLMVEGALAAVAHIHGSNTLIDHKSELARRVGSQLTPAAQRATELAGDDYTEAAAAALAVLSP